MKPTSKRAGHFDAEGRKIRTANSPIAYGTRRAGSPGRPCRYAAELWRTMAEVAATNPLTWPTGALSDASRHRIPELDAETEREAAE